MADPDWYKVLQVAQDADAEVISAAFRALSKKFHPDSSGHTATLAQQQLIGEAYAVLSDPHKRAAYDTARLVTPRVGNSSSPDPTVANNAVPTRPVDRAGQTAESHPKMDSSSGKTMGVRQRQADARERHVREVEAEQERWRVYYAGQQRQAELAAQRLARQAVVDRRRNFALLIIGGVILLIAVAIVVRFTLLYSLQPQ